MSSILAAQHVSRRLAGDVPVTLIGTLDEMVEELQWRREEYGISYFSVEADVWESLAPVVSRLAGT